MKTSNLVLSVIILCSLVACSSMSKNKKAAEPAKGAPAKVEIKAEKKEEKKAAAPATASATGDVQCGSAGDQRVIAVATEGEGCKVNYTKTGQTSSVASAVQGREHCDEIAKRIRGKLEGAGFACK